MRPITQLLVLLACAAMPSLGGASGAHAGRFDHVVYPTGEFPADVENIQAAVDLGGRVLLKAADLSGEPTAFNFGPPVDAFDNFVLLTNDVEIQGERIGTARATIRGGSVPLFGAEPVEISIRGLKFEGPLASAIIIVSSTGAKILDNEVSDVVGFLYPSWGITEGRGIKFLGGNDPDGAITGHILVAGNVIRDLNADLSEALLFEDVAGDITVVGNRIERALAGGIAAWANTGSIIILGNYIAPGIPDAGQAAFGNGVVVYGGASCRIAGNVVVAENPDADGIIVAGNDFVGTFERPVIAHNHVVMRDSLYGGITLVGDIDDAIVSNNRIEGSAAYALDLLYTRWAPDSVASSNRFVGNNIARFESSIADIFLDTHTQDTLVVGRGGSVIDLGVNNKIIGLTPKGQARVSQDLQERRARKKPEARGSFERRSR